MFIADIFNGIKRPSNGSVPVGKRHHCGNVSVHWRLNSSGAALIGIEVKRDSGLIEFEVAGFAGLSNSEKGRALTSDESQNARLAVARLLAASCPDAARLMKG